MNLRQIEIAVAVLVLSVAIRAVDFVGRRRKSA